MHVVVTMHVHYDELKRRIVKRRDKCHVKCSHIADFIYEIKYIREDIYLELIKNDLVNRSL